MKPSVSQETLDEVREVSEYYGTPYYRVVIGRDGKYSVAQLSRDDELRMSKSVFIDDRRYKRKEKAEAWIAMQERIDQDPILVRLINRYLSIEDE